MTEDEAYKVHIQYTFNAFCKIVIRHAAIDKILKLRRRWEREISLDYWRNTGNYAGNDYRCCTNSAVRRYSLTEE